MPATGRLPFPRPAGPCTFCIRDSRIQNVVLGVDELLARDKASLDIFWLKDESLSDSDNLPAPDVIAAEIIEDLQAALDQLKELEADLPARTAL